jgi:hypothetical protein
VSAARLFGALGVVFVLGRGTVAQEPRTFVARLSAVPVDTITVRTTLGEGSVKAVLEGNTLTVRGKFDALNSPATVAHLRRARKGMRGPEVFELTVTKDKSGTVEGTLRLTPVQVTDLERGWYYVQIHTELNTAGHLRGWLSK